MVFEGKFRDSWYVSECRANLGESISVNDFLFDKIPVVAQGSDFLDRRLSGGESSRSSCVVDEFTFGNVENAVKCT